MTLQLNEIDLKELDSYIQELPVKYGLPLLNFINTKIKIQQEVDKQSDAESEQ